MKFNIISRSFLLFKRLPDFLTGNWVARHGRGLGAGLGLGIRRGQRLVRSVAIHLDCWRSDACGHKLKDVRKKCIEAGLYANFICILL